MRSQQEAFKVGERSATGGTYYCAVCDAHRTETLATLDEGEVLPVCATCEAAGRPETDQLWVDLTRREAQRRATRTRWREMWTVRSA
jgi:hypothetical protein